MSLGRATRAYVSGYDRTRVHESRLMRGESRRLVADFNGALEAGQTITAVTWRTDNTSSAILSDALISGGQRSTSVRLLAGWSCRAAVKCEATISDGGTMEQLFAIEIESAPYFMGETNPVSGPSEIAVNP